MGIARHRRVAAAAVAAAAPLSLPHAPPATATWLYVLTCTLAHVPEILVLRACSGAPSSQMRISFLCYIGSFSVWSGVKSGLVHANSSCTGGIRSRVVQHARGVLNCTPGACNFTCFGRVTPCTPRILGAGLGRAWKKKYIISNALLGHQSTEYFSVHFRATFVTFSGRGVLLLRRASKNKMLHAMRRWDHFSVVCPQTRSSTP